MKCISLPSLFLLWGFILTAQTNVYTVSFENAVHHEAVVTATFPRLDTDTLLLRMSRTSPGRYALHEFAKNVYGFRASDSKGNALPVTRPDPYSWKVAGHDGSVSISYTLYANRGDGTYSQVDETHAHLNIPATFMYAPGLRDRRIEVTFNTRQDLHWKVATQLPLVSGTTFYSPDLYYFMDSPVEISDFDLRSFEVPSGNTSYRIQLALHHLGSGEDADAYFERIKKVVLAEKQVYGEFPEYDFGSYIFLVCYMPNASGDGMEHRNSTVVTGTRGLAVGGMDRNLGTISHEFFHGWNVERMRPGSLEPFDFEAVNMSGELWFAEGFTSYYTGLNLCRAGLKPPGEYIAQLAGDFNYVWNSPARDYFSPIEMSFQAPFVDAATSVDPVNRENTFISYYSYGSVLGLALDLSLREIHLNLDDFMKHMWAAYGKKEVPYTVEDIHTTLNAYAGAEFGDTFFNKYIYDSQMPDYETLFKSVGVVLGHDDRKPYFGAEIIQNEDGTATIDAHTLKGSPAYNAGLEKNDIIIAVNGYPLLTGFNFEGIVWEYQVGDTLRISYMRTGRPHMAEVVLAGNPEYFIELSENRGDSPSREALTRRNHWLNGH